MLAEHTRSPVLNQLLESGGLFTSNGAHNQLNAINPADTPIPGLIYFLYIASFEDNLKVLKSPTSDATPFYVGFS